jgi:eukaryotic-like serine/threonine-protein kinase
MKDMQNIILGNRYTILEKIGEGGMALVFKARCQLLNRFVAIKILRPEFTEDEDFVNKFRRESLAAASLSHPNIVSIYDVGEQDGIYYIVMEYVSGKTLKEYIKENGKLDYREALNITNQIANALENAHKNGVVHRDIKPHNILVTDDKIIKVTDFGIARASNSATIVNTGAVMGSVHYFSPEQARGGFSDHRTDIYSLGVVLYEMLTGNLPYNAESPVTIALKHIQEDFIQPAIVDTSIPETINDIVVRAMEKDMNKRYQSARELIDDIEVARNNPYKRIIKEEESSQLTQVIPMDKIEEALNKKTKEKNHKKGKKIAIISGITVVAIGILVFAAVFTFNKYFVVKDVSVPDILNMKLDQAKTVLKENKLELEEGETQNSDSPAGEIIKVSPYVGQVVKEGSTVTVIISAGKEQVVVPDLTNKNLVAADLLLEDAHLVRGKIDHKNNEEVPKNLISSQTPAANSSLNKGDRVDIVISDGPLIKTIIVPRLLGLTLDKANEALAKAKFKYVKTSFGQNDSVGEDIIIGVNASEGESKPEDFEIEIIVNRTSTDMMENTPTPLPTPLPTSTPTPTP